MIRIDGDTITERGTQFGVEQFNSDLTTRYMECDSKEEAQNLSRAMGGFVVERNIYCGSWGRVSL